MTTPEIPDAVIYAMAREIRIVDHPLASARCALAAALAATDEDGRFYYHRDEYLRYNEGGEVEQHGMTLIDSGRLDELEAAERQVDKYRAEAHLLTDERDEAVARAAEYADALRALHDAGIVAGTEDVSRAEMDRYYAASARARALLAEHEREAL